MAKITLTGGKIIKIAEKIGLGPGCCCGGCCEYGVIFPIDFHAVGNSIEGNPFDVSGTATDLLWFDELGNSLGFGPCSEIPEENVYLSSIPGFAISFQPAGSGFTLFGGIPVEGVEDWACDQVKNIAGSSAYLVGAFQVTAGSVTFS